MVQNHILVCVIYVKLCLKQLLKLLTLSLPISVIHDNLRKDQIYLLKISQAAQLGNCSEELARPSPSRLSHSHWLTTENQVLRLYVSSPAPSLKLKQIAEFIIKVYAPN